MSTLTVKELLKAPTKQTYNFRPVPPDLSYKAKVVAVEERPSQFGGNYFKVIFEITEPRTVTGTHVAKLVTYLHGDNAVDRGYLDFTGKFFDLNNPDTVVDTNKIPGRECRIFVVQESDRNGKSWLRVTDIYTELNPEPEASKLISEAAQK